MVDSQSPVNSSRTRDTRADSKVAANGRTSSNKTLASVASSTAVKAEEITSVSFVRRETSFQIPRSVGGFFSCIAKRQRRVRDIGNCGHRLPKPCGDLSKDKCQN